MGKAKKIMAIILAGLLTLNLTYGAEGEFKFEQEPTLVEKTTNSVTIKWEPLKGAESYFIGYGKVTGKDVGFYDEDYDVENVETTEVTINNLEESTTYYIAVNALDKNGEEAGYSEELVVKTKGEGEDEDESDVNFGISDIEVIDNTSFKVIFTKDLDSSENAVYEGKLEGENDGGAELDIDNIKLDSSNTLLVTLTDKLVPSNKYTFTIISAQDSEGNNIESGIDGTKSFPTDADLVIKDSGLKNTSEEVNEVGVIDNGTNNNSNDRGDFSESNSNNDGDFGKESSNDGFDVVETTENTTEEVTEELNAAAESTKKLPNSGPEHVLLIVLALILALGFNLKTKKS